MCSAPIFTATSTNSSSHPTLHVEETSQRSANPLNGRRHRRHRRHHPARQGLARLPVRVRLLGRTVKEMSDDDATHMAAGVSYYALFSIFPLLLFLISALSLLLEPAEIRVRLTEMSAGYFPGSQGLIDSNLDIVLKARGALGLFGMLGLLWAGSAVFGAVSRSINRAWDVQADRPFIISKPRQLAMAAAVGLLFLVSLSAATVARATELSFPRNCTDPPPY